MAIFSIESMENYKMIYLGCVTVMASLYIKNAIPKRNFILDIISDILLEEKIITVYLYYNMAKSQLLGCFCKIYLRFLIAFARKQKIILSFIFGRCFQKCSNIEHTEYKRKIYEWGKNLSPLLGFLIDPIKSCKAHGE